jgi:hypothetical protein
VEASLVFVDLSGTPVAPPVTVNVTPGQIASVDLPSSAFLQTTGTHVDVIPTIRTSAGPALLMLKATYEVFDSQTGLGAVLTSGLPARRAALAPQGLAAGQIMRLIVTSIPPDPCLAALSFADSSGNPLGTTLQVDLTPG